MSMRGHAFSQAHLRVYFMGIVKLALVTPATMSVAIILYGHCSRWTSFRSVRARSTTRVFEGFQNAHHQTSDV